MTNVGPIWDKALMQDFIAFLPRYITLGHALYAFAKARKLPRIPSNRATQRAMQRFFNKFPSDYLGSALDQEDVAATQPLIPPMTPIPSIVPSPQSISDPPSPEEQKTFIGHLNALLKAAPDPIKSPANNSENDEDTGDIIILAVSDTHWGSDSPDTTRRVGEIPERIAPYIKGNVSKLYLLLLGDIIEGDGIYPAQCWNVDMPAPYQWTTAVEQLWRLMQRLNTISPLTVIGQPGNHGRTGNKKSDKHPLSNFDVLAYSTLDFLSRETASGIRVICSKSASYHVETIGGQRVYIRHEAPSQLDTPARQNKGRGWARIHNFNMMFYGHVHHWGVLNVDGIPVFRVGTVKGPSDHSDEIGQFDYPSCTLVRFSPEKFPEHAAIQLPWLD